MSSEAKNEHLPAVKTVVATATKTDANDVEKAVEQVARGADVHSEDPTRSNMHTGTHFTGDGIAASTAQNETEQPEAGAGPSDSGGLSGVTLTGGTITENAAGAVVGTLTVVDPDAGDTHTFAVSDDRFEVVEGALRLKPDVAFNHEAAATIDVEVTVTDAGGLTLRESFTVNVADINEGPESVTLTGGTIAENAAGAVVGTLTVVDPDAGDSHTFAVSDDRFEVVDGALRLKPDVALNHEDAATIDVEVTVTDAGGLTLSESFTVNVADINEGPESVTLTGGTIAENAAGAVVGTLTVVDPDAGDSHTFAVSDDRFEVVDGALRLKPDVALNHGDAATIEVEVTVTDAGGLTLSEGFTVNVAPPLEAQVESGFHARYFDVDERLDQLDDVSWDSDPTFSEVTSEINYTNSRSSFWEGGDTETFAAEVTGTVEVTEGGMFDFYLSADDGAHLFINGAAVVDNDGLHGYRTRSGEIELEPGLHHIEVRYFENTGMAGLRLEWEGPGTDGRSLVEPAGDDGIQTINGVSTPLEFSFPGGILDEGVSVTLEGMPEGTIMEAGDQMVVVDASGRVDVTDWDLSMVTFQAPVEFTGTIDASVVLEYLGGEALGGAENRVPLNIEVSQAQVPEVSAHMTGGFQASYFDVDHSLRTIEDIAWDSDPTYAEVIQEIDYTNGSASFWEGGSRDTFGVRIEGEISVDVGGTYSFHAGADDGVVVFINGEPVVENDGLHGFRTRSGEIELEPGTYEIEVRYFENYGHAGLRLEWEGPDTDGRELVQANPVFEIEPNGTFDVVMNVNGRNGDEHIEIDGLPPGTLINSGDDAQVVEGEPIDVSNWNLDSIQISPPPDFEGQIEGTILVLDTAFNGAEVSNETPFAFTVGDPENKSEPELIEMMAPSPENGHGGGDWTETGEYDHSGAKDDVMRETVENTGSQDTSHVALDIYERSDL